MVAAVEPGHFNLRESWEDHFEGIRAGGRRGVPLTLQRTKLLSQSQ